jgi:alginate O-acetyltransferase complex protein AlgI
MIFSSLEFAIYLISGLLLYYLVPLTKQWAVLLLLSVLFVGYFSIVALVYCMVLSLVNFIIGKYIFKAENKKVKKNLYLSGLTLNIGQLIFLKYINFLLFNLFALFGLQQETNAVILNIIIPIGVSYYTFQGIGYLIDVYKFSYKPSRHLGKFILYQVYFPKFLAGPIERSKTLLNKLNDGVVFSPENIKAGAVLLFWGFFKKLVVADRLVDVVTQVNNNVGDFGGITLYMILFLQVVHIYCDFSGYTDMVLGISNMFGLQLTDNFNRPLFSQNVSMFWRRWHISLSSWCNDYIFNHILLKRRKWKKWAAVYAVFITFFVIGVWHGDRWTYIVLGILQGVAINYEFFTKRTRLTIGARLKPKLNIFLSRVVTLHFVALTILIFYAQNLRSAWTLLVSLFVKNTSVGLFQLLDKFDIAISLAGLLVILLVDYLKEINAGFRLNVLSNTMVRRTIYYTLILTVMFLGKLESTAFVYLNF